MKTAVIGANGNLVSRITKQTLDRGYEVKAIIYSGEFIDKRAEYLNISLFDLKKEDVIDCEVIISAFGGGFNAYPTINKEAFDKYIELLKTTNKKLITICSAESLYTDESRTQYEFETPTCHPVLKEISKNIKLGINELKKIEGLNWTVVFLSRTFDHEGLLLKTLKFEQKESSFIMMIKEVILLMMI